MGKGVTDDTAQEEEGGARHTHDRQALSPFALALASHSWVRHLSVCDDQNRIPAWNLFGMHVIVLY